jgi:hypothetical protein
MFISIYPVRNNGPLEFLAGFTQLATCVAVNTFFGKIPEFLDPTFIVRSPQFDFGFSTLASFKARILPGLLNPVSHFEAFDLFEMLYIIGDQN